MNDKLVEYLDRLIELIKKAFEKLAETVREIIKQKADSQKDSKQLPSRRTFKIVKKIGNTYEQIPFKRMIYRCRNNC